MGFTDRAYDSDQGSTCLIRQSEDEVTASGAAGGEVDANFHVYSSGSRRRFGLHARGVSLSRSVGEEGDTATKSGFLAYPTVAAYDAVDIGDTVTIGEVTWTVAAKVPEKPV